VRGDGVRVIPVLDLRAGRAVLARGGLRDTYRPAPSVLAPERQAGDALALARAFRERLGCDECYVADLDAIAGAAPQAALVRSITRLGVRVLLDSGVADPARAQRAVADGVARVVVGLETLPGFAALRAIAAAIGSRRIVFSLDLRGGEPILAAGASHRAAPLELAEAAVRAGAPALIVLDLARVGNGLGPDRALVAELRRAHPQLELLVGGGVGSRRDLERLADAGCDGALVGTALHDGRLGKDDLDLVRLRHHASDSR
jgi:phosphoribosylformimino-5-aminoimidazole carboxamide ribotide isomerase